MPNDLHKEPAKPASSPIHFYIDGLEFTQATQNWPIPNAGPGVPLIERKDLSIRVYLGAPPNWVSAGTKFVGELRVPGLPVLYPVTGPLSGAVVNVNPPSPPGNDTNVDQRADNGQSLIFTIPGEVCIGTLSCTLTVYPVSHPAHQLAVNFDLPSDQNSGLRPAFGPVNHTFDIPFRKVQPLRIQPVLIQYDGPVIIHVPVGPGKPSKPLATPVLKTETPALDEVMQTLDWVKKVYPISDLTVEPPLTSQWSLDILQPENMWALRQQVADLRPAGDNSTIYVGFLSPDIFTVGTFQMSRGIGLVDDHTALTVAGNGPATAHAIGRALGLLIIGCQTPLPAYAIPFSSVAGWKTPKWSWLGGPVTPSNVTPPPTWSSQVAPHAPSDPGPVKYVDGAITITVSRDDDQWLPSASGFGLTLSSDVTVDLDPQNPSISGVSVPAVQGFGCDFVLSADANLFIFNLNQFPNEKTSVKITLGNVVIWNTDDLLVDIDPMTNMKIGPATPVHPSHPGPYIVTDQFASDTNGVPVVLYANKTYHLAIDADIGVDGSLASQLTYPSANVAQATSYSTGIFQFVPSDAGPIIETLPPSGNLPAGTIQEVGVDNQQFWVYDPNLRFDFMSFCDPSWVSPYTYMNLLTKIDAL